MLNYLNSIEWSRFDPAILLGSLIILELLVGIRYAWAIPDHGRLPDKQGMILDAMITTPLVAALTSLYLFGSWQGEGRPFAIALLSGCGLAAATHWCHAPSIKWIKSMYIAAVGTILVMFYFFTEHQNVALVWMVAVTAVIVARMMPGFVRGGKGSRFIKLVIWGILIWRCIDLAYTPDRLGW